MYLVLIGLPILGSIISGFFGRKIGVSGSHVITCTCVITTTILAIIAFLEVGFTNIPVKIHLFRWIDSEYLNISWTFNFDSLTVSMLIPVLMVSCLVHVYSIGYMSHDPHNQRFFSYLSLFTFMMIILVTADNYLVMFVGWEGVGVCSYLLVSFWFTRIAANQSSLAAFLTNRVGDCVLTIGMFGMLWAFGNLDYTTIFSLSSLYNETIIIFVGICLLIGAMAKSSQVGLHVWLPMAMEGPTPVSALIHAATMVTAGVYLLMRSSPLIEYSSTVLLFCLWVGAITTVFSSLIGLFQQDIKKVIAYSTMSQLGMMVIAVGLSSYNVALFHLINHAFYKGLLFLGAGAVIHAVADNQDFRKYGGLISYLPLTYSVMLIASLSLVAFPFMTGFYSKDFILESAYGQFKFSSIIVYFIATIGAIFTTLYSVKVLYLTFLSNPNGPLVNYKPAHAAHEGDIFMSSPLIILAIFSIFFGYITKDIYIGMGSDFFSDNALYIHPSHELILDTEFAVSTFYKLLPLFFTILFTIISLFFTEFYPKMLMQFKLSSLGYNIFGFFNQRFLVEKYYNLYISGLILKLGEQTSKVLDKGAVELFGPYGLEKKLSEVSYSINSLSTGVVTTYSLYILIGVISYISVLFLSGQEESYLIVLILFVLAGTNHVTSSSSPKVTEQVFKQSKRSTNIKEKKNLKGIVPFLYVYHIENDFSSSFNIGDGVKAGDEASSFSVHYSSLEKILENSYNYIILYIEKIPELHNNNMFYLTVVLSVLFLLMLSLLIKYKQEIIVYIVINYEILYLLFSKLILIYLIIVSCYGLLYSMGFELLSVSAHIGREPSLLCPFSNTELNFVIVEYCDIQSMFPDETSITSGEEVDNLPEKEFVVPTIVEMNHPSGPRGNPMDIANLNNPAPTNPMKIANLDNPAPEKAPVATKTIVNITAYENKINPNTQRITDSYNPDGETIKKLYPHKPFFEATTTPRKLGGVEVSLQKCYPPYADYYLLEPSPFAHDFEVHSGQRPIETSPSGHWMVCRRVEAQNSVR